MRDPRQAALERLRRAIGEPVEFDGTPCVVHELVDDPPVLVLRPLSGATAIQADTFGKAARRAPGFIEIPVFAGDGDEPSEALARVSFPDPQGTR